MSRAEEILELINEIRSSIDQHSYRGGKRHKRVSCPKGYRLVRPRGSNPSVRGTCKRQKADERRKRKFGQKRAQRKRRGRRSVSKRIFLRTLKRRKAAGFK